jgi:hypothetical protein
MSPACLDEEPEIKAHLLHLLRSAPVARFLQLNERKQEFSARLRHPFKKDWWDNLRVLRLKKLIFTPCWATEILSTT